MNILKDELKIVQIIEYFKFYYYSYFCVYKVRFLFTPRKKPDTTDGLKLFLVLMIIVQLLVFIQHWITAVWFWYKIEEIRIFSPFIFYFFVSKRLSFFLWINSVYFLQLKIIFNLFFHATIWHFNTLHLIKHVFTEFNRKLFVEEQTLTNLSSASL